VDNYLQGQELEDYINLSLQVEYDIFSDVTGVKAVETKNSIYHFNQNLLEFIHDSAILSVYVTSTIAASPAETCQRI